MRPPKTGAAPACARRGPGFDRPTDIREVRFDYGSLDPSVADDVRTTAVEIRKSAHRMLDEVLASGRALQRVKEVLPHGDFGEWLTTEFGWKERTAQSYMRVAGSFGENPQRVLDLPLRSVYTLAAQPHSTRSRILDLVDEGKRPDEKAIASIIREDRWERQEAAARQREEQRRAKLTPEERQREDNARARASTRKANEAAKREQERLALEKQRQAQEAAAHEAASLIARSIPTCIDS